MKKTLLLASVATILTAANANAQLNNKHNMNWYGQEVAPYIGVDYVYDHASYKKEAKDLKKNYNSGLINLGVRTMRYTGIEAFFQHSGTLKSFKGTVGETKSKFYTYGADLYGYLPIGCEGFNLLGSLGLGNYNIKYKRDGEKIDKDRIGYRMGIGMQYDFTNHIAARVMGRYNYIGTKHLDNLKEITVGMRYSF